MGLLVDSLSPNPNEQKDRKLNDDVEYNAAWVEKRSVEINFEIIVVRFLFVWIFFIFIDMCVRFNF